MCKTVCEGGYAGMPIVIATFSQARNTMLEWYLIPEGMPPKFSRESKHNLDLTGETIQDFRREVLILETLCNTLHILISNGSEKNVVQTRFDRVVG